MRGILEEETIENKKNGFYFSLKEHIHISKLHNNSNFVNNICPKPTVSAESAHCSSRSVGRPRHEFWIYVKDTIIDKCVCRSLTLELTIADHYSNAQAETGISGRCAWRRTSARSCICRNRFLAEHWLWHSKQLPFGLVPRISSQPQFVDPGIKAKKWLITLWVYPCERNLGIPVETQGKEQQEWTTLIQSESISSFPAIPPWFVRNY